MTRAALRGGLLFRQYVTTELPEIKDFVVRVVGSSSMKPSADWGGIRQGFHSLEGSLRRHRRCLSNRVFFFVFD